MVKWVILLPFVFMFSMPVFSQDELDDLLEQSKTGSTNEGLEELDSDIGDMKSYSTTKKSKSNDVDDLLDELDTETAKVSKTPPSTQSEAVASSPSSGIDEEDYEEYEEEAALEGDPRIARFYKDKKRISDDEWKERIGTSFEERYIIVEGDTLWDISSKFLDSPWYWPKIWELNSYITNPHLIFPGNEIKFSFNIDDGPSITLVQGKVEDELKEEKDRDYSVLERETPPSKFDKNGFHKEALFNTASRGNFTPVIEGGRIILGESPQYTGEIYAARTIRTVLLPTDKVEIDIEADTCSKGARYFAIENYSGSIYNVAGELTVIDSTTTKKRCVAKIDKIYSGLYRGVKLTAPIMAQTAPIRTETAQITGKIYGFDPEERKMAGDGDRFFIRFNDADSPMPGTLLYLYEIKDPNSSRQMDPYLVGVAKLIHSSGRYATASIITSSKTITSNSTVTTRF